MRKSRLLIVGLFALLVAAFALPAAAAQLSGAIFTTDKDCIGTNLNIYQNKGDVYLDGGPTHPGAAGLPDGVYYVQVTDPSGANVLGKSLGADVTVSGGEFAQCYQLSDILYTKSSDFTAKGYDDSPNNGDEYKVWVSTVSTFANDDTKTDNFKVKSGPTPPPTAELKVVKFYDANANGINDDNQPIAGWKVRIQDKIDYIRYTPVDIIVDPDMYTVTESDTVETNWVHTTPNPVNVTLNPQMPGDPPTTVEFGNLCTGAGGGLTLGFWSNKNGQALYGADDNALMVSLNLRDAKGSNFDPANYNAYNKWLLSATATNMAYMLSAQLSAMELNVLNGKVSGSALIYAPGTNSANSLGYASVNNVMAEANTALADPNGYTVKAGPTRTYQEKLMKALDNANNNRNVFVQSTPCPFSFAS